MIFPNNGEILHTKNQWVHQMIIKVFTVAQTMEWKIYI
jgi:hypothetical protein